MNDPIRTALENILREVGALGYHKPYSGDSYLPEHLVQEAKFALNPAASPDNKFIETARERRAEAILKRALTPDESSFLNAFMPSAAYLSFAQSKAEDQQGNHTPGAQQDLAHSEQPPDQSSHAIGLRPANSDDAVECTAQEALREAPHSARTGE